MSRFLLIPSRRRRLDSADLFGLFLDVSRETQTREADLSELEIYLDLISLNLESEDDVLGFLHTYGPLGLRRGDGGPWWGPDPEPYAGIAYFGFKQSTRRRLTRSVDDALDEILKLYRRSSSAAWSCSTTSPNKRTTSTAPVRPAGASS